MQGEQHVLRPHSLALFLYLAAWVALSVSYFSIFNVVASMVNTTNLAQLVHLQRAWKHYL